MSLKEHELLDGTNLTRRNLELLGVVNHAFGKTRYIFKVFSGADGFIVSHLSVGDSVGRFFRAESSLQTLEAELHRKAELARAMYEGVRDLNQERAAQREKLEAKARRQKRACSTV